MPDRAEVMREAEEYLETRNSARAGKTIRSAILLGIVILFVGILFFVVGNTMDSPERIIMFIVGMVVCIISGPILNLGINGHGPFRDIGPPPHYHETDPIQKVMDLLGKRYVQIIVSIVALILLVLALLD